jgi:hypothetical protein
MMPHVLQLKSPTRLVDPTYGVSQRLEDKMKAMRKLKLRMVLEVCVALLTTACGSGSQSFPGTPQSLIVGRWEMAGAPVGGVEDPNAAAAGKAIKMSAEFNRDGTARMTMMGQTLQGAYKVNGENELEWTMSGLTTKSRMNVTMTELDVTDEANRTIRYKRK